MYANARMSCDMTHIPLLARPLVLLAVAVGAFHYAVYVALCRDISHGRVYIEGGVYPLLACTGRIIVTVSQMGASASRCGSC
jgi:hypothetical protein